MANIIVLDVGSYGTSHRACEILSGRGHGAKVYKHASHAKADMERQAPDILAFSALYIPDFDPNKQYVPFLQYVKEWYSRTQPVTKRVLIDNPQTDAVIRVKWESNSADYLAAYLCIRSCTDGHEPDFCDLMNMVCCFEQLIYR